jgi:hypothetical protein
LKGSSATSARPTPTAPRIGRSSDRPPPTLTSAEQFALAGPSDLPDPDFNAYRKDLADIALAGRVIVSHYAEPLQRSALRATTLRSAPSESAEAVRELAAGEPFALVDDRLGWAWGYAGAERRVGYVRSEAIG